MKDKESTTPQSEKASWGWFIYFLFCIAFIGGTGAYLVCIPLYGLGTIWSPARKLADALMHRLVTLLMAVQPWLLATNGIEVPSMPGTTGLLFVSNHRSHLDAFLILARIPGIRIFAKKSLFAVPFLGWMMRFSRQIPVDRGNIEGFLEANEEVRRRLRLGERVHVFPEMTRCPENFRGTQNFSLAPFHVAVQEKVFVVPLVFCDTDRAWPKGDLRIRFRRAVSAKSLAPLEAANFASASLLRDEIQRRINAELEDPTR